MIVLHIRFGNLFHLDPNNEAVATPYSSCEEILTSCLSNLYEYFNVFNTISRIERLSCVQYIICAMELLLGSTDECYTISTEFAVSAFQKISNIHSIWKPIDNSPIVVKIMCSVRAHYCCEAILGTIIMSIERMKVSIGKGSRDRSRFLLSHELRRVAMHSKIALQALKMSNVSMTDHADGFHYELKVVREGDAVVPRRLHEILKIFSYFHCDPPRFFTVANSSLVVKVQPPLADIIANSTDPICQICHAFLDKADGVIVLPECNHVCCRICQEKWFYNLFKDIRPWQCATCQQRTVESCSVYRDGTKVVHLNCANAGAYVKFVISKAAEDFETRQQLGPDTNWLKF